jgi:hypothetical protein
MYYSHVRKLMNVHNITRISILFFLKVQSILLEYSRDNYNFNFLGQPHLWFDGLKALP